jgi:excisionase family DNA binding protein
VTFVRFFERVELEGMNMSNHEELLTPGEVARLFAVDPKTVSRWANSGKITAVKTLGGHRRFRATEIRAMLTRAQQPRIDQFN